MAERKGAGMAGSDPRNRFVMKPGDIVREDGYPDCAKYRDQLDKIRAVSGAERAEGDLRRYITTYSGGKFDSMVDREHPDEFTGKDFNALRQLNVSVVRPARSWLCGEGLHTVRELLGSVPDDRDIWEVEPHEYGSLLGRDSEAWQPWHIVAGLQRNGRARRAGVGVTAGKLLHGKRPRLIPIYDSRIRKALKLRHKNAWEVMWCALRDNEIRNRLECLEAEVTEAAQLSLLRVLDIVIWMS
jgi:hypothetical protein